MGSSASGRSDRDDLFDDFPGDRLDVSAVGGFRVGHDRRRVRVHQDDGVALLAERFARLGAGVIELAGLPDDDGAGTDEQNFLEIGALGIVLKKEYCSAQPE